MLCRWNGKKVVREVRDLGFDSHEVQIFFSRVTDPLVPVRKLKLASCQSVKLDCGMSRSSRCLFLRIFFKSCHVKKNFINL